MSTPLQDQVAIVTGAGRGIGQAIAMRLARDGAQVVCISRNLSSAEKGAAAVNEAFPGKASAHAVDVADHLSVKSLCAKLTDELPRIDILVNNAGVTRDNLAMRMSIEEWDDVLNTNLKGAFNFIQGVQRTMIRQRSGRIINISSVVGLAGNAGQCNYAASKAGLIGLTKSLARELSGRQITVNAVAPGFIATDMTDVLSEDIKKQVITRVPLGRFGKVEDIAAAVGYLAGPDGGYITGQVLTVDGGMVM